MDNVEVCSLVSECSEMSEYIKEAIRYHLLPFRRSVLQSGRTIPRSAYKVSLIVVNKNSVHQFYLISCHPTSLFTPLYLRHYVKF